MQVTVNAPRPPYVEFITRAVEDRSSEAKLGVYMTKDVVYALITPAGSKDRIERVAEEWLEHITQQARQGNFDSSWVQHYKSAYAEWMAGNEVPVHGIPIKGWQLASPATQENLIRMNIRTVEDLAQANENALQMIGMGGRALKDQAIAWLQQGRDQGVVALEITDLKLKNASLLEQNELLREQVKALQVQLESAASEAKTSAKKL